jgi:hypothetical protein
MTRHQWKHAKSISTNHPMMPSLGSPWFLCRRCGWAGTEALNSGPRGLGKFCHEPPPNRGLRSEAKATRLAGA